MMARLVIELTNRCNLRCQHCFTERHAATGDLPLPLLERVLLEGQGCGITHLSFTGGEPTIHRQFPDILRRVGAAGYTFSFVSNGLTFPQLVPLLLQHRPWFTGVTFSLDGAREATHDQLRGPGAYRRVMRAVSCCVVKQFPFTLNMVLTAPNCGEVAALVQLAARLGSHGVRFGYLMPTPETAQRGLDLPPQARRAVEAEIWELQRHAPLPVTMAPGYFSTDPFFPCGPLTLEEFNLDYRGNLTLCCQLSGHSGSNAATEVMGNLHDISLADAVECFRRHVATYLADKQARVTQGAFGGLDHFPCWYCLKYLDKVSWLGHFPQHPWAPESHSMASGRNHVHLGSVRAATP
jgi:MoaA/NifB/PqqE/SkfB family radical SAM enzyme